MRDYRYNPFSNALEPIAIAGETHVIPTNSPFTIRLNEVPLKESPSSVSLTIGGAAGVEVAADPAAGQFRCDYTTGADGDDSWNTGLIQFNASDSGKTVVVAYKGMGALASVNVPMNFQLFTTSGTFVVPPFVEKVYITGCGGGGAGGGAGGAIKTPIAVMPGSQYTITIGNGGVGSTGNGTAGGASSFGSLLTLGGGGGGLKDGAQGSSGGSGGSAGSYAGGGSYFGAGGHTPNGSNGCVGSGFGSGGSGGAFTDVVRSGGNGTKGFILVEW